MTFELKQVAIAVTVAILICTGILLQATRSGPPVLVERDEVAVGTTLMIDDTRIEVLRVLPSGTSRGTVVNACEGHESGIVMPGGQLTAVALTLRVGFRTVCLGTDRAYQTGRLRIIVRRVAARPPGGPEPRHEIEIRRHVDGLARFLDQGASIALALGLGVLSGALAQGLLPGTPRPRGLS